MEVPLEVDELNFDLSYTYTNALIRGVTCIFRGVRTVKNVPQAPKARAAEGSGGHFRARKCHFQRFPGNSFINQNMKKRRVFSNLRRLYVNLLLTGGLMRDLHRVKLTGKGRDKKIRYLLRSYVCEHVELYFQGG